MVSEALGVNEIIEGEDARKKAECSPPTPQPTESD